MQVVDLNGKPYKLKLTGYINTNKRQSRSQYHLEARDLLHQIFPTTQILEEVSIKVARNNVLYLDFFLPLTKLCIEVHGEQHYKFTPFFHKNQLAFYQQKKRDNDKKDWCEINNINLIVLKYDEQQSWRDQLI